MERTLVIIKPDGVRRHLVGSIIQRFEAKGLAIAEMKFETMTPELAKEHYQHLTERSFFDELIDYMTSGPVVYLVLVGEEVIDIVRKMVGEMCIRDSQIIATNAMTTKRIIFFIFSPPLSMCNFFNQLITDKLT